MQSMVGFWSRVHQVHTLLLTKAFEERHSIELYPILTTLKCRMASCSFKWPFSWSALPQTSMLVRTAKTSLQYVCGRSNLNLASRGLPSGEERWEERGLHFTAVPKVSKTHPTLRLDRPAPSPPLKLQDQKWGPHVKLLEVSLWDVIGSRPLSTKGCVCACVDTHERLGNTIWPFRTISYPNRMCAAPTQMPCVPHRGTNIVMLEWVGPGASWDWIGDT